MELKGVYLDEETGELRLIKPKYTLFGVSSYTLPEIILTEKEAKERGFDLKDKSGFYTELEGRRILINIRNRKGEMLKVKNPLWVSILLWSILVLLFAVPIFLIWLILFS